MSFTSLLRYYLLRKGNLVPRVWRTTANRIQLLEAIKKQRAIQFFITGLRKYIGVQEAVRHFP